MPFSAFRKFLLIILLISGNAFAQAQLPKCVLFGFGNCIGTLRFSNGDIYTGEFNYGKPNGKGTFTYGNGDSYNGTVAEGQRHGSGIYTSTAGDKYVGQFSEGKFDGAGTYYFLANNRSKGDIYVGEFSSNTFNGQGRYTHANGQVFVGSFVNGRKAVPIVAPETLLAKAEVQRLAEENAKQKAQLESLLKAERRERLARENQTAAKQDAQAVPIAAAASVVAGSSDVDKASLQPLAASAKTESTPAAVEVVAQPAGAKDSTVQAPLAAEDRSTTYKNRPADVLGTVPGRLFFTGSVSSLNKLQVSNGSKAYDFSVSPLDASGSLGLGYRISDNYGAEIGFRYIGKQSISGLSSTYKATAFLAGAYAELPISSGLGLLARGGLSSIDSNLSETYTSTSYFNGSLVSSSTTTVEYSYQKIAPYFGVGASLALDKNNQITLDYTKLRGGLSSGSVTLDVNFDLLDLGWKYSF